MWIRIRPCMALSHAEQRVTLVEKKCLSGVVLISHCGA